MNTEQCDEWLGRFIERQYVDCDDGDGDCCADCAVREARDERGCAVCGCLPTYLPTYPSLEAT